MTSEVMSLFQEQIGNIKLMALQLILIAIPIGLALGGIKWLFSKIMQEFEWWIFAKKHGCGKYAK